MLSLTKEEWFDFISLGIPRLRERESKNAWDIGVNGFTMDEICNTFFCYAYAINRPEEWQCKFQKVQDMNETWDMICGADWSAEDKAYADNHSICIADLVINKVNELSNQLF